MTIKRVDGTFHELIVQLGSYTSYTASYTAETVMEV